MFKGNCPGASLFHQSVKIGIFYFCNSITPLKIVVTNALFTCYLSGVSMLKKCNYLLAELLIMEFFKACRAYLVVECFIFLILMFAGNALLKKIDPMGL